MNKLSVIILVASAAVLPLSVLSARAEPQLPAVEAPVDQPTPDASAAVAAMPSDDLESVSAGESVEVNVLTNQQLTANNTGNSVNAQSVVNGDISLSGSALNGYSGVGNFVMNTGNNNNVQGSVSVTIASSPIVP